MEVMINQVARQFLDELENGAGLEERLKDHRARQLLYKWMSGQDPAPFRDLLVRMYDEEIKLRREIWQGSHRDDLDLGDGIYDCAFLLHCCGNPADSLVIWNANRLDQDIGELDARFLVGAGVEETLAHLRHVGGAAASEIIDHIGEWVGWGGAASDLRQWQASRQAELAEDSNCRGVAKDPE